MSVNSRQFRRNALYVALLTLPLSAPLLAADIPQVQVTVSDQQCDPMQITIPAGKTQFVVHNTSKKNLEWEILKGVMVVEERENIAPGFTQKMTATLEPGEYDMTCGLLSNPKGKLTVTAAGEAAAAKPDALALVGPLADYKVYVIQQVAELVTQTKAFTDAVKKGDLALARKLYAPTRQHYERIEPIAELFSDLDNSIDAREDDFDKKAEDPPWITKPIPFQPANCGSKLSFSSISREISKRSASSASILMPISYWRACKVRDSKRGYNSVMTRSYWARL